MGLRATDETVVARWKRVSSANAASSHPKLVGTTTGHAREPSRKSASRTAPTAASTVNTTTPTLRDTFVDSEGGKANGTFQIFDSTTDSQVGDGIVSPFVPSGQPVSVTVPFGVLTNGRTYKFRRSPYDGSHCNNGSTAWKPFTVGASVPSAPAKITSSDYPTKTWVKGVSRAGTFTLTRPHPTTTGWSGRWTGCRVPGCYRRLRYGPE
ncbi:hypothetical protein FHV95_123109 [Streptomyces coelicolor]|nr:hypothetical protein FHV91_1232 [Streptomyces coelicolor]TYP05218.1 hypothetical protein FHV98_122109 [Streptomyces coelicolor A3(2)]TYP24229.1 hypothetical protein FHV94_1242 [Streptomyces coelicolor]TYP25783.1 hypothetical protein FHV92_1232 [Streptomyces coelicolor]TYP44007.1 hypothetical protein FHV95_123109 [Streptomyces coelicolor]